MTKPCEVCKKKPSTRATIIYHMPNKHIGFFKRFLRTHWRDAVASRRYVCEDCYFEYQHGMVTLHCNCKKSFMVTIEDMLDTETIHCPFCKENVFDRKVNPYVD